VSWHQDIKYWGLAGGEVVTAWLALSPASVESGCMRVLPRSHEGELMAHEDRYDAANLLTRGQEIAVEVDEARAVSMALEPGQMSLHNVQLAHASGPNRSKDRRIGLSMHFMPTAARQTLADWDSATLVRGEDRHGNFQLSPRPGAAPVDEVRAFHARATAALRDILYKDAHHHTGKL
jgi:ectoine hydroxylase-related dioxygenase (phytanoyl-CoA dioxygenase family)